MKFELEKSIEILERTPKVLNSLLYGVSDDWTLYNEGGQSWSPFHVVSHLILGEKTDWIPRTKLILGESKDLRFTPFDMVSHLQYGKGKSVNDLLDEFEQLRKLNIDTLHDLQVTKDQLKLIGIHPVFGEITLQHLIATWVTHDLNHIVQISRVMAKRYKENVGPWVDNISVLNA